jgi:prepilin-type N-terminal cleavage/methylation domain-containing protein
MKKGFTLIEMAVVLLIIGILMAATMRFGSGRIVDLKAQSTKEQFIGRYNDLYSQNMTSSFRNGKKYETLTIVMNTGVYYIVDELAQMNADLL